MDNHAASTAVIRCLAASRRRSILGFLRGRTAPVSVRTAATIVAADERGEPPVDVTRPVRDSVRTDLVHVHLPRLADLGLVRWDRADGTVAPTDHPAFADPLVTIVLDAAVDEDASDLPRDTLDDLLDAIATVGNRAVLATLAEHGGRIARADLARDVFERIREHESTRQAVSETARGATDAVAAAVREAGVDTERDSDGEPDAEADLLVTLHHVTLPALEAAGLVAYDAERGTVTGTDHPVLDTLQDTRSTADQPDGSSVTS